MKRRCLREIFHEMLIKLKWWHVLLLFALVITAFVYSLSKMEFTSRIYLLNFAICSYLFLMPNPTKINFLLPGDKISRKSQVLMKYKVIFWGNFLLFCMIGMYKKNIPGGITLLFYILFVHHTNAVFESFSIRIPSIPVVIYISVVTLFITLLD